MKSAFTPWAKLEATQDDSSMSTITRNIISVQIGAFALIGFSMMERRRCLFSKLIYSRNPYLAWHVRRVFQKVHIKKPERHLICL